MRIIAGDAKGRRLFTPSGREVRPTSDRVKESLFNILGEAVPGAVVLDLFAGTGNLGLESLSRGAERSIFIDNSRDSIRIVNDNIRNLKYEEYCEVYNNDALSALAVLKKRQIIFDIIFVDPPYSREIIPEILRKITELDLLNDKGIIAAEHDIKDKLPDRILNIIKYKSSVYGDTILSFYKRECETLEE